MGRLTIDGSHTQASTNSAAPHQLTAELVRFTANGSEGFYIEVKDAGKAVQEAVHVEVTPLVEGLIAGTPFDSRLSSNYGVVSTRYESEAATLTVFVNPGGNYTPASGDVFAVADDHSGANILFGQIDSVTGTNPYTITPQAVLAHTYAKGSPVVFNMEVLPSINHNRDTEGIARYRARPAHATSVTASGSTHKVEWTKSDDAAVLYTGCVLVYASDLPFVPKNWTRIDGLFPDAIMAGDAIISGAITTMNGGEAIGTGLRYFLVLFCANRTAAQFALAAGQPGPFDAILSPFHPAECSATLV